jgi:glycosyltransferase involved in cell wall biosynthesis
MRVLFVTNDNLSQRRAGPAVRCIELARVLAREHEVTVASAQPSDSQFAEFTLLADARARKSELRQIARSSDVVVTQGLALTLFPFLAGTAKHLVVDIYDPYLLEYLAHPHPRHPSWGYLRQLYRLNQQLLRGDFFLCANERQRDYWLGCLSALGRLTPLEYKRDPGLFHLIDVVPFGLPAETPRHSAQVMRGMLPGIGNEDFVLLWAGGIWQWLDPLTVIRAVAAAARSNPRVKLVFLGTDDPNPANRPMSMVEDARRLASELGVQNTQVFFQSGWVRYEDRHNWLLESDVGVSAHHATVESRFAFRTRVLDYIWAGLPMIVSAGDYFGDWVAQEDLGHAVAPGDVQEWERAIVALASDAGAREGIKGRLQALKVQFQWQSVAEPLRRYCAKPYKTERPSALRQRAVPLLSAIYDSAKRGRR